MLRDEIGCLDKKHSQCKEIDKQVTLLKQRYDEMMKDEVIDEMNDVEPHQSSSSQYDWLMSRLKVHDLTQRNMDLCEDVCND